jgi:threonine synthase
VHSGLPEVAVNPHWTGSRCTVCGRTYGPTHDRFVCNDCGPIGTLDVHYDYAAVGANLDPSDPFPLPPGGRPDLWRFAPLLPVQPAASHAAWSFGATPLHAPAALRAELNLPRLHLKDDTGLPSASLKDRAAAVAVADCRRLGREDAACASTGNAAASLAVLGARAGLRSTIFVPAAAPRAKLAQLLLHGARVIRVDGTYDQAYDLSLRVLAARGWYSRNCAHNPLLVEGKKTAALEIAADLGWGAPDAVFVPVGDGCIVSSVGKAFAELKRLGICETMPRIYGVQAAGAAPLARAWSRSRRHDALDSRALLKLIAPVEPATLADSIAVGVPRNRLKAWRTIGASGGGFLSVSDEQILAAVHLLARLAGVWAEPSGAAALAGLRSARAKDLIGDDELVVVMVTGHGLKDPGAVLDRLELPEPVPPDLDPADLALD